MSRDSQHPWKRRWFAAGVLALAAVLVASLASAAELDLGALVQPVPLDSEFAEPGYFVWCGAPTKGADEPRPLTCRIMPVGDSITEGGSTFSCYRYPLLKKLTDAGYPAEYVGSRQSDSPAGRLRHEGYGGKNAEFLAAVVSKNFQKFPADIVLLHCGHNFFADEQPVPRIVAATETLICSLREVNPRVTLLLAQVIPSGKLPKYSYIPALNEALSELAKRLHKPEQPVILVNQADGFDWKTDTVEDKVHPNAQGAEKMAARWFAALTLILEKQP